MLKIEKSYQDFEHTKLPVEIKDLGHEGYTLNKPIFIDIKLENGDVLASYSPLGIFEYSENINSVIQDTKNYLVDLYDELTIIKDVNLTPLLVSQKKHIKSIISKTA